MWDYLGQNTEKVEVMLFSFWEKEMMGVDIWKKENWKEVNRFDHPQISHSLPRWKGDTTDDAS